MTANFGISQRMSEPVTVLPGVGTKRAETLAKLEIKTVDDLLRHYPKRYEDRRRPLQIGELKDGEAALIRVCVLRINKAPDFVRGKTKRIPMKVYCYDRSGEITLLFFNARWLSGAFQTGAEYWVYGMPKRDQFGVSMAHPDFDLISSEETKDESGAGIIPVYPLTAGVSQKYLRSLIRSALPLAEKCTETLPGDLIKKRNLAPLGFALSNIHFPDDGHSLNAARYRLVYEELFLLQYKLLRARAGADVDAGLLRDARGDEGDAHDDNEAIQNDVIKLFPFELTGAQKRSIEEINTDMTGPVPMRRLLQGDVGSGKTAVAAAAAYIAAKNGLQTAIMAPTEILALQHFQEFTGVFKETFVQVGLLTSGLSVSQKRDVKDGLKNGEVHVVIGTHALIEPDISFKNLGLVVTDEQHRFGVRQRLALKEKGRAPDTLVMTATPIPRTLAMMLYADLDVSVLDEMPPGRMKVTTRFINSSKRESAYEFAEKEIISGRQVYVVAPMIGDEAEDDEADDTALASAIELNEELKTLFPKRRISMLHGRMKSEQKEEIMHMFAAGDIDLLVSTVVIEVGVNIPNASVMIVENAERFGLAQLHQLRGRVGRGAAKSYCILISDSNTDLAVKRLETLAREHDGFKIAELDLSLRGPGDLFGVRQHGLPELKIADPVKHMDILKLANSDAKELIKNESHSGRI